VWLIRRAALDVSLLATKFAKRSYRPARGELRPEISAGLARIEPVRGATLVIDPFAGSGAIGRACRDVGAKIVWLNDIRRQKTTVQASAGVRWTHADFRELDVAAGSVAAVVTDPPWGVFEDVREGVDALYGEIGSAAYQWLAPGGALVLLTGAPESAVDRLLGSDHLRIELELPVLVNGRKATVIRARKPAS
jgi:tRNA G10  N-methylase Trm11